MRGAGPSLAQPRRGRVSVWTRRPTLLLSVEAAPHLSAFTSALDADLGGCLLLRLLPLAAGRSRTRPVGAPVLWAFLPCPAPLPAPHCGGQGTPQGPWRAEPEREIRGVQVGPLQWPGDPPAPTGGWLRGGQRRSLRCCCSEELHKSSCWKQGSSGRGVGGGLQR